VRPRATLRIFLPRSLLDDRAAFLHICDVTSLSLLSHARHTKDNDHLCLAVVRPDHQASLA